MDCETVLTKDKNLHIYYVRLPKKLVEEIDHVRHKKKYDDPNIFKTRNHIICAALEEFIKTHG